MNIKKQTCTSSEIRRGIKFVRNANMNPTKVNGFKSSKKKSKARHTNAHIQGKPTDVNFCYVSLHKHPSQLGGMLSHILGWFLFVIFFFLNAFSFCPTIQTKRPNFNFPHFFVFLCARCKTLMNLLLVVPKTRVVVNVRLCAFVDHRRLTRNLKN